jgi:hypothetical protein
MEMSLGLEDANDSERAVRCGLGYFEKAADLAPHCVETAARYGCALIALRQLSSAELVLQRGLDIRDMDCVHPFVNHIGIKTAAGTKEQLIAGARLRMKKDIAYIKACQGAPLFDKVLKLLPNRKAQCSTILNAAEAVAAKQHGSARARLLYPHVVLDLIRLGRLQSDQLTYQKRETILQAALEAALDLVANFPNSLVISLCCAKLQLSLGFYDAAEKELRRALKIANPDDPRDHEIPFGCTKGVTYKDRVLRMTLKTIFTLISLFGSIESTFRHLIEESKGSFLSVKVDTMLESSQHEQEMTGLIHDAVDCYRINKSWLMWKCPWNQVVSCQNFTAPTPEELIQHVLGHASLHDDGTIFEKLLKHTLDYDVPYILDLAKDGEGKDVFIIKNLDVLFGAIYDVLTNSMTGTSPPNPRLLVMANGFSSKVYICSSIFAGGCLPMRYQRFNC